MTDYFADCYSVCLQALARFLYSEWFTLISKWLQVWVWC